MSTPPEPFLRNSPGNRKGTPAALAGAVAFLLQILVWSFVAPVMAVGQMPSYCLLEADEGQGTQGQDAPQKADHQAAPCGYCLLVQGVGVGPSEAGGDAGAPVSYILAAVGTVSQVAPPGWLLATLQARGPPSKSLL